MNSGKGKISKNDKNEQKQAEIGSGGGTRIRDPITLEAFKKRP